MRFRPHFPLWQLGIFLAHLCPSEANCEAGELPHKVAGSPARAIQG